MFILSTLLSHANMSIKHIMMMIMMIMSSQRRSPHMGGSPDVRQSQDGCKLRQQSCIQPTTTLDAHFPVFLGGPFTGPSNVDGSSTSPVGGHRIQSRTMQTLSSTNDTNLIKPSSAPCATNQSIPTNTPYYATQPPHTGSTKTVPKSNYRTTIPYGPATLTLNPPSQHNTQTIQHQPSPTLHYT